MEDNAGSIVLEREQIVASHMMAAKWGKRLLNYFLDLAAFYLIVIAMGVVLAFTGLVDPNSYDSSSHPLSIRFYSLLLYIIYYIVFEYFTGKTFGKLITKTKVINKNGTKPEFGAILGRSLARLVPFEPFSFLSQNPIGWHDSWSNTMVVNDIDLYNFNKKTNPEEEEQY